MVITKNGQSDYGLQDTNKYWIPTLLLAVGATPADLVTVAPYQGYSYDIADDSMFNAVVPEDWQPGTDITLHIRWCCNETRAANDGEVNWQAIWETVANDASQVIGTGTTATVTSGDQDLPTLARQLIELELGTIPAVSIAAGDTIGIQLSRIALVGGSDPVQDPEIYAAWFEYTRFISYYT